MLEADPQPRAGSRAAKLSVEAFQKLVTDGVPLAAQLGCGVQRLSYGQAIVQLPYSPALIRPGGTIGGPAMMTLADIALWGAVLSMVGPVALAVTTDLTFHFLRKPPQADLQATATILQLGRRLAIADCLIATTDDDRPLGHAVGTYALPDATNSA